MFDTVNIVLECFKTECLHLLDIDQLFGTKLNFFTFSLRSNNFIKLKLISFKGSHLTQKF